MNGVNDMKYLSLAIMVLLSCHVSVASAASLYNEARSDAMGGTGVAASNREGAAFINPALLAINAPKYGDTVLMLPVLGVEVGSLDNLIDKFDALQDSYDSLEAAIDAGDVTGISSFRDLLISDLESLDGENAYASVGLGFSVVLPTKRMPMSIFYKTYIDVASVAVIEQSDIDSLTNLDPNNPPEVTDLDSQGAAVVGAISDLGLA